MKVIKITIEEAKANWRSDYNTYEWNRKIDMYNRLTNAEFYLNEANDLFVVYTIDEGIRFLNEILHISSLTNNGFKLVDIKDGEIKTKLYKNANGESGLIDNTKSNRKQMAFYSKNFDTIFTNIM
jgi:hypothetical protein